MQMHAHVMLAHFTLDGVHGVETIEIDALTLFDAYLGSRDEFWRRAEESGARWIEPGTAWIPSTLHGPTLKFIAPIR